MNRNVERVNLSLSDVIGTVKYSIDFCKQSSADTITALAIGSKTHALALGIAALSQPRMEVICRIPTRYTTLDVEANVHPIAVTGEDHHQILALRFHDLQQNLDRLLAVVALVIRSMQVIGFINERVWKNVTLLRRGSSLPTPRD